MTQPNNAQGQGYASASLYVGDLPLDVGEPNLFDIFNAVGPVQSVRVCRDAATRRSLGYGYVNFHRVEDAERVLETMNFTQIRGKACRIMWSHRDPSLRKSGAGNVFVKHLDKSIDNKQLYDTFSMFGNILSCKVATDASRESLGYGFVHYESEESAKNAIKHVNGMLIAEKKVDVMQFKSRVERGGDTKARFTNVYAKNLVDTTTEATFRALFTPFGEITSCMLAVDEEGKSKGYGFVNFAQPEQAAEAVNKLNGQEQGDGKPALYVCRAQTKGEREKELREQFEQLKVERQKKYEGVNLYVKNLADDINDERLREEFSKFGDITSAKTMFDNAGKSRGFGFVCFSSPEEATKAVTEMNGKMLDNKPLYVGLAQRKEYRRAQLEAQYASRVAKIPMQQPGMYPPQANPMGYFPQGMQAPRVVAYPQPVNMRRWNPQGQQPMMGVNAMYNLAAMQQQPPQQQRGPAARNGGAANGGARRGQPGPVMAPGQIPMVAPLTVEALAQAPDEQQKQMIGERLFPLIHGQEPQLAAKITGMLLEMDNGELLHLIESPEALREKIEEALQVLHQHQAQEVGAPQ